MTISEIVSLEIDPVLFILLLTTDTSFNPAQFGSAHGPLCLPLNRQECPQTAKVKLRLLLQGLEEIYY